MVADGEQKPPYLGLEDDNERDEAHADKGSENSGQYFHLKGLDQLPDEEDGDDADEDTHGGGAFQQAVEAVKQQRDQEYIDDVEDADLNEEVNHNVNFAAKLRGFSDTLAKSVHQSHGFPGIFHVVDAQDVGTIEQSEGVQYRRSVLGSLWCGTQYLKD